MSRRSLYPVRQYLTVKNALPLIHPPVEYDYTDFNAPCCGNIYFYSSCPRNGRTSRDTLVRTTHQNVAGQWNGCLHPPHQCHLFRMTLVFY